MNNINGLDDQSLLLIFDRLSVEALLRAGRVCSRWNSIRGKSARTRHSLKLLIGSDVRLAVKAIEFSKLHFVLNPDNVKRYIANFPFRGDPDSFVRDDVDNVDRTDEEEGQQQSIKESHQMQVKSLSEFGVQFLFELFPNLQTLTTSLPSTPEDINPMIALLKLLSPLLTTLKLYTYNDDIDIYIDYFTFTLSDLMTNRRLWTTVNSLTSLRVLHFDIKSKLLENEDDQIALPIVRQLEQFCFNTHDNERYLQGSLFDSFTRFGAANTRLKHIAPLVTCDVHLKNDSNKYLDIARELDKCFTQIRVQLYGAELFHFVDLCSRLTSLTTLDIGLNSSWIERFDQFIFYRSVAQLKELVALQLHSDSGTMKKLCFKGQQLGQRLDEEIGTLVNASVRSLNIEVQSTLSDHRQMIHQQFHRIFPKVRLFLVEQFYSSGPCRRCAHELCLKRMSAMLFRANWVELQTIACPPKVWTRAELENLAEVEDEENDSSDTSSEDENRLFEEIFDDSSDSDSDDDV